MKKCVCGQEMVPSKLYPSVLVCHRCGRKKELHAKKTNGDRIRAMTDEELARIHYFGAGHCKVDPSKCTKEDCEQCYLDWLKQPVEEDEDG